MGGDFPSSKRGGREQNEMTSVTHRVPLLSERGVWHIVRDRWQVEVCEQSMAKPGSMGLS